MAAAPGHSFAFEAMKMNTTTKRAIALVSVLGLFGLGMGCELLVDFDRSKIDAGVSDASFNTDTPVGDQGTPDVTQPDVASDSPADSGAETGADTGSDTAADTGSDTGGDADAGGDAGSDAGDAADACDDVEC